MSAFGYGVLAGSAALLPASTLAYVFTRNYWGKVWEERGIRVDVPLLPGVTFAALYAGAVGSMGGGLQAAAAASALAWMFAFAANADLVTGKIPREPMWAAGCLAALIAVPFTRWVDFLSVLVIIAGIAAVTVLVSGGGLGSADVRMMIATTPFAFFVDIAAFLFALLIAAVLQALLRLLRWVPYSGRGHAFGPALGAGFMMSWLLAFAGLWSASRLSP